MALLQLYNEQRLLVGMKHDTICLIRSCAEVNPIKKLVECHDILDLTLEISHKFPAVVPKLPECDEAALLRLRTLSLELAVFHHTILPRPDLDFYVGKIQQLLRLYQVPRGLKG